MPISRVSDIAKMRIDEINVQIEDIAAAARDIADTVARHKLEAKLIVVKTKRERLRAMTSIAKLMKIQAELDIILAGTEMSIELEELGGKRRLEADLPSEKRARLSEESSAQTRNRKYQNSSGKKASHKDRFEPASKPRKPVDENMPPSLRTSTPLKNQVKNPQTKEDKKKTKQANKNGGSAVSKPSYNGKSMIFLNNPPARDMPQINNDGYYTTDYYKQTLGYVPKDLSVIDKENGRSLNIPYKLTRKMNPALEKAFNYLTRSDKENVDQLNVSKQNVCNKTTSNLSSRNLLPLFDQSKIDNDFDLNKEINKKITIKDNKSFVCKQELNDCNQKSKMSSQNRFSNQKTYFYNKSSVYQNPSVFNR